MQWLRSDRRERRSRCVGLGSSDDRWMWPARLNAPRLHSRDGSAGKPSPFHSFCASPWEASSNEGHQPAQPRRRGRFAIGISPGCESSLPTAPTNGSWTTLLRAWPTRLPLIESARNGPSDRRIIAGPGVSLKREIARFTRPLVTRSAIGTTTAAPWDPRSTGVHAERPSAASALLPVSRDQQVSGPSFPTAGTNSRPTGDVGMVTQDTHLSSGFPHSAAAVQVALSVPVSATIFCQSPPSNGELSWGRCDEVASSSAPPAFVRVCRPVSRRFARGCPFVPLRTFAS